MKKSKIQDIKGFICVLICVLVAMICRVIGRECSSNLASFIRSFLYIGLFTRWGVSVRRNVMQVQVRRLMTAITLLMIFWIADRTVKYMLVTDPIQIRYLWYLYYFPMLFIPFLSLLVAISLGRLETYRLPRWTAWLYIPVVLLVLLVLTNDVHQLIFAFPQDGTVWLDDNYHYGRLYFTIPICMAVCGLSAVIMMIWKCRGKDGRRTSWLPLLFIAVTMVYAMVYKFYMTDHTSLFFYLAGDVTVVLALLFTSTLESCLHVGLIPTNTGYDTLFRTVVVGMLIVNERFEICYASDVARPLSKEELRRAVKEDYFLEGGLCIRACPIQGGYAVWQEDRSELLRVRQDLEKTREELQKRNEILREQYQKEVRRYRLEEQNRLYDLVQRKTQKQIQELDALSRRFVQVPGDSPESRKLLLRILVLTTYIKRYKDMVISADRSLVLPLHQLEGALRESCSNLAIAGIEGNLYMPRLEDTLSVKSMILAYKAFEEALEEALETLTYYFITLSEDGEGKRSLRMNLECKADLTSFLEQHPQVKAERDEDGWFLSQKLMTGGKMKG